jgi:hypothetical protein
MKASFHAVYFFLQFIKFRKYCCQRELFNRTQ